MDAQSAYVISVLAPDRPGIIADVSSAIYELGGNLEATSQTIIQHWFTMLVRVTFPDEIMESEIASRIEAAGCEVIVCPEDISTRPAEVAGEPYVLTVVGQDKPGIVRALSCCCADRGVNITPVWNEVRDNRFVTIFHVTVPRDVDPSDFRHRLDQTAESIDVSVTFQHQDIFTATNSLQVHTGRS